MKATNIALASVVCGSMFLSGCAHRLGDFTVASTKNIDVKSTEHRVDESERLVDRDTAHIIIFFPTGIPNMKEAMDNVIEQRPGAVGLSNVTVKRGGFWIPFIYGQDYFEIEGNPIYEVK
ncbi:MAG: hypothetical protein ACTH3S_16610 [Marinobacter sp.]|uniref:hypothetical protein n=1 Tax=Marinobacter sp. TaxID=50741 RepID=UPI003F9A74EE